jgi:general secretion pathway protein D
MSLLRWLTTCFAFASLMGNAQQAPAPPDTRAAEKFYAQGVKAVERGDADAAEKAFSKAVQADPSNPNYRADLQIARQHSVTKLVQEADVARLTGHPEVARAELAQALTLDPKNEEVTQHIEDLADFPANPLEPDAVAANFAPPIELSPKPGNQSFHLKGTEQEVLQRVVEAYGLRMVADDSVQAKEIRFDADDVNYSQAANLLSLATDSFMVPLDPTRVLVAKATKDNHQKYDRVATETIRLPGLAGTEVTDIGNLARNVLGIQQAAVQADNGTLTVRGPVANLIALNRTLADLLDGKSEMVLDVKIYMIDDSRTSVMGVQLPQTTTLFNVPTELNGVLANNSSLVQQIISSGLANAGDYTAIAAILIASGEVSGSILTSPFATFGNGLTLTGVAPGSVTGNLSLNVAHTRVLQQVQMRLEDNAEGTVKNGMRYPIETSSYSSIAASSVSIPGITSAGLSSIVSGLGISASSLSTSQPIPQVQYEDLGLTLKVTPRIDRNDDVVLKLDLQIQALQGSTLNGLPVLTNQQYQAILRLRNEASALVVGDLSRSESAAISGTPGLSELPGFSSLGSTTKDYDVSSMAILVTPHIVRRRHADLVGPVIHLPRGT